MLSCNFGFLILSFFDRTFEEVFLLFRARTGYSCTALPASRRRPGYDAISDSLSGVCPLCARVPPPRRCGVDPVNGPRGWNDDEMVWHAQEHARSMRVAASSIVLVGISGWNWKFLENQQNHRKASKIKRKL